MRSILMQPVHGPERVRALNERSAKVAEIVDIGLLRKKHSS
jgi:hypothetical protein